MVDPGRRVPVIFGNGVIVHLRLGQGGRLLFKLLAEGLVVEEGPGIIVFVIPCLF